MVMSIALRGAAALVKKFGGGAKGLKKAKADSPHLFKDAPKRTTTKLDNRTGKPVSGSGAPKSVSKASSTSRGGWNSVPANIRNKLLAGNTKGMSQEQLVKYRILYKNRNQ
jgi:hypothetical protein